MSIIWRIMIDKSIYIVYYKIMIYANEIHLL